MNLNFFRGVLIFMILGPFILSGWLFTILLLAILIASFVVPNRVAWFLNPSREIEIR